MNDIFEGAPDHVTGEVRYCPGSFAVASTSNSITVYVDPCFANYWPDIESFTFKQGWRDVACSETPAPVRPRAERLAAPAPQIVGGGPMRRRWR